MKLISSKSSSMRSGQDPCPAQVSAEIVTQHEPEIERPLGPMESFVWQLDQISRLNFVVHAEVKGRLAEAHVRQALRAIQARHPLLRVRVETRGPGKPSFRSGTRAISLRVLDVDHARRQDELNFELNTGLPTETGPLVRCVLLRHGERDSSVMLCFHHVIADGQSGACVMRDLIQAAAKASTGENATLSALGSVTK